MPIWLPTMTPAMRDGGREAGESGERVVPMRLQRFLARSGVASRRGSEDLMTAGRVRVNGVVVSELGAKVDPSIDVVEVDGLEVSLEDSPTYLVLNKPAGYVTTMDDPHGRPTVADLVPRDIAGLFPVGRLDADSTGALVFMTDGELAHRLLHPRYHVAKDYVVVVDGCLSDVDLDKLRGGIVLDDGPTKPTTAELVSCDRAARRSTSRITLTEGRKRQVKRMFSAVGHPVLELHRVSFGPVRVDDVAPGAWRTLTDEEIAALRHAATGGGD